MGIRTPITPMIDAAATLRLLAWLSPSFPTGAYAYSHGLEWAVETRDIHDGETLRIWLEDVLTNGAGRSDVIPWPGRCLRRGRDTVAHAGAGCAG